MKGNKTASDRLNAKTLDQMFVNMVEQGYECSPFLSNAILETTKSVFVQDQSNPNVMNVGQLMVLGIAMSEPAGKPLTECEMKTAVVTLDAGKEDEEIRSKYGLATLRQTKLARVTHEARDQGVTLTQEDIASKLLNCGVRTVRRDIKALAKRGVIVPTRGQQKDIGPGVSHKVETVRLFIERKTYTEIERILKHSLTAIKRYILTFSRVAYLTEKGYRTKEIAFLVQSSERLTQDYQALYRKYKEDPAYKDHLDEILALNSADREISNGGGDKLSMYAQQSNYAPLLDKTFETAVSGFILAEFPKLGGPKVVKLLVKELKAIVEQYYPPLTNLRMGQMLWFAVAKEEKGGYGKCMKNLRLRPVVLSVVTYEDIQKRADGVPQNEIRKSAIARMLREADEQGGTLAETDPSLILFCSLTTIKKDIAEYERENNVVLPRRGTVHDLGRSTTHKKIICEKSLRDKKATPDIARETYHSPNAVDRYLGDFDRVRFCLKKGLSVEETSFTTQLSKSLVVEYEDLIEELYGGGEKENVN